MILGRFIEQSVTCKNDNSAYLHFLLSCFRRKRQGIVIALALLTAGPRHWCHAKILTFSYTSVITEDIHLKLRVVVRYQKGNPYQQGR